MSSRVQSVAFEPTPIFIVGHWRSGTTLLHQLLCQDRQFCFPSILEVFSPYDFFPTPLHLISRPLLRHFMPKLRPMDGVLFRDDLPQEHDMALAAMDAPSFMNCFYFPRDLRRTFAANVLFDDNSEASHRWRRSLVYFLSKLLVQNPGKRLMLKSPADSVRIQAICELFPRAKFIHIHRHPADVLESTIRLYKSLFQVLSLQEYDSAHLEEHINTSYLTVMSRLRKGLASVPDDDLITVSYDDLTADPVKTASTIYDRLGLENFDIAQPAMKKFIADLPVPGPREPMAKTLRAEHNQIMSWLGY